MLASAATFSSASVLCSTKPRTPPLPSFSRRSLSGLRFRIRSPNPKIPAAAPVSSRMEAAQPQTRDAEGGAESSAMKLLFVEMGVGYDQHGQDITAAAVRACKDAITSNSIPAFRGGSIPGVNTDQMKLQIKLGVPRSTQHLLDAERVKAVFPYGEIISFEVVDGGMICSSGVCLEAMGDKNDDCYIVNAAVYVGY
ncbi:hypothetical protein HU200_047542 [Digitaria exilis]|uniref:Uncharacterized protein n=1 Tax=Digitaria exilis TaxID=1010633 RepID=A0A835E8Q3_9POAL|nr:hypothetical protein HU200_047542 [Digitaria exilis]